MSASLPIQYRDGTLLGLLYRVPARECEGPLQGLALEPFAALGQVTVLVCVFEYRDTSIGAYNELGIAVHAKRKGSSPRLLGAALDMRAQEEQALFVATLPVTTEGACRAGIELWGYPKYVTPIDTRFDERESHVRLGDELEITAPAGLGPLTKGFPFVTYSVRDGQLVRTVVEVDHHVRWGGGKGTSIRLVGPGQTSEVARALGLDRYSPMAVFRTDRMRATLPAGRLLGPAKV